MKYSEDPLLKSNEIVLKNNILNLYSAFVRKEDFESKRSLNSLPYITGRIVKEIKPLITKDIIQNLEYYIQQKILKRTIKKWFDNNILPFPLIRISSFKEKDPLKKLCEYIEKIESITNFQKLNFLKLPKTFKELLSDDLIYFYGYLLGDGCISKERLIKLCDGHPNPEHTHYSLRFLESIQKYIKEKFNLSSKLTKINNKYELVLTSKFLCRFFKFFYDFKKDQGILKKPSVIKDKERSHIFYRGYFDADAGIKSKDKYLALKCNNKKFLKSCKIDFKKYGINASKISYDNLKIPFFKIYAQNLYAYAKNIGFNHPRKKEDLIYHLKKGCLIKKLNSIKTSSLIDKYYDLSKIPNLRIKGISNEFKKYRKLIGTQQHVANLLKTYRENIKRWENGTDSIPFKYYLKLMKLNGFDPIDVLKDLSTRDIQFGKGKLKQFIRLPIKFSKSYIELFQYLNPTKNKTFIKSYGIDNRNLDRKKLLNKIKNFFNTEISKDSGSDVIFSTLISSFLKTFYNYSNSWDPLSKEEINKLKERWQVL